jgi:glutathione peroxidase-family protein
VDLFNWIRSVAVVLAVAAGVAILMLPKSNAATPITRGSIVVAAAADAAPPFTHNSAAEWINSPPLKWDDLRGKVVLIDIWTFECWNCYRSFPWLHGVERRYTAQGLQVIGVHSPEFDAEKVRSNIEAATRKFELTFPVMIDSDHSYWNALGNSYWPAFYLVDKQGRIRARFVGETHDGDANALKIEATVKVLLAEPVAGSFTRRPG